MVGKTACALFLFVLGFFKAAAELTEMAINQTSFKPPAEVVNDITGVDIISIYMVETLGPRLKMVSADLQRAIKASKLVQETINGNLTDCWQVQAPPGTSAQVLECTIGDYSGTVRMEVRGPAPPRRLVTCTLTQYDYGGVCCDVGKGLDS